ncbi:CPBP family intramembrane metalloprotease [bacterium]|nr:CPBP family intramembrane metalloprotease [bacterium]
MAAILALCLLAPVSIFLGLFLFRNVWITFFLFHGIVCTGIPLAGAVRSRFRPAFLRGLGFRNFRQASRQGVLLGLVYFLAILIFFSLFRNRALDADAIRALLSGWHVTENSIGLFLFMMIVANAMLEEIFWRGYIFSKLEEKTGLFASVLISSFFYASYHFLTTVLLFRLFFSLLFTSVILIAGILWGILRFRSGSLYGPMISHLMADLGIMTAYWIWIKA